MNQDDERHLDAAVGWLGLGDWAAANDELEEISPLARADFRVLKLRLKIYCAAGRWEMAETLADSLIAKEPKDGEIWYHRALATCNQGELKESALALQIAFGLNPALRGDAIEDPTFDPLWKEYPQK